MKRFAFPLQKLLELREFREREAELSLGRAISRRDGIKLELEAIARKRFDTTSSRRTGMSIHELLHVEHFVLKLDTDKERLIETLAAAELVVEREREKYLQVSRERQVITKLREKKESLWRHAYLADEASVQDDITNSRINT